MLLADEGRISLADGDRRFLGELEGKAVSREGLLLGGERLAHVPDRRSVDIPSRFDLRLHGGLRAFRVPFACGPAPARTHRIRARHRSPERLAHRIRGGRDRDLASSTAVLAKHADGLFDTQHGVSRCVRALAAAGTRLYVAVRTQFVRLRRLRVRDEGRARNLRHAFDRLAALRSRDTDAGIRTRARLANASACESLGRHHERRRLRRLESCDRPGTASTLLGGFARR